MEIKQKKGRLAQKIDIEANWLKAINFVPVEGELIIYRAELEGDELPPDRTELITYDRLKRGDGSSTVSNLPFLLEDYVRNSSCTNPYGDGVFSGIRTSAQWEEGD